MTEDTKHLTLQCQFCQTWNRIDAARAGDRPKCGNCGRPILLDRPWILTEDSFDRTISESEVPVLVDFYADWCGPCKMMAPALDEFARRHVGEALVLKMDTDANPATASRLGIRGIPTLIVFEHGQERRRHVGAAQLPELEKLAALKEAEAKA